MLHVVKFTEPAVTDVTLEGPGARVNIPVWQVDQTLRGEWIQHETGILHVAF